jgi:hypothetical protein
MDNSRVVELIDANTEQAEAAIREKIHIWAEHVVFSDLWWMGVGLTIIPWIIWFMVRPKQSTDRLLYIGLMAAIFSTVFDVLGDQIALWHYRFNVIPILPTYIPWDLTLMPVSVMLALQFKPNANPYMKASIFAVLTSYVAEPFFNWLGVYQPKIWRYSYSLPIQFLVYIAAHYLLRLRNRFSPLT